ncbi:MAG: hypothetical protein KIS76_12950 [Pyrinomonadaceae bacterium]|nr:hypothetical protein [Pyrinomonadaceae bacterium]
MEAFDSIKEETRKKFGIGDKADSLVDIILAMIADEENGSFPGFLRTFESAGLGDLAMTWVNVGANMPISYEQTESVYGEVTLKEIARETGLDYKTATYATAFVTPTLVNELTPTAEIPTGAVLRERLQIPSDPVAITPESKPAGFQNTSDNIIKILIPLSILALLIAIGYSFCN